MATRSKKPCSYPGCSALTTDRYCEKHKQETSQQYNRDRGSAAQRGYDARWRKAREAFLRVHPLCIHCLKDGKVMAATVVDHIKPHKGNRILFWDRSNWQALCASCHSKKTATEDGGFGNSGRGRGEQISPKYGQ
ncbi:HNH endonuclease [Brevibacillus nitrificans]|uniref:HNH endonuclease n=1 Tax=Brevibacillus nitrificans TaxID=651560 RepID=UPI0026089D46|nr:HNH endonuclease [Brevibacillus nitrificans]